MHTVKTMSVVTFVVSVLWGLAGCSSSSAGAPSPTPTPVAGATTVYVEQSFSTAGSRPSGSYITYDGSLFQYAAKSRGDVSPTLTQTTSTQDLRGLATDTVGNLYVGGSQSAIISGVLQPVVSGFVQVYAAGFTASSVPVRTVYLPGADNPEVVAVDSAGQLYVLSSRTGTVYVFASGASGNATPIRTISGAQTAIATGHCFGLAVDSAGQIYVSDFTPSQVLVFAAGANGNVAPLRTITITAGSAQGVAVDGAGNLFVGADDTTGTIVGQLVSKATILEFGPSSSGSATPLKSIAGSATTLFYIGNLQLDAAGNLWMVNLVQNAGVNSFSVVEFGASASGNVAPNTTFYSSSWSTYIQPSIAVI